MKRIIGFFTKLCEAYLPDAFIFCSLLTLVVFGLALTLTPHGPLALVDFWAKDLWSLNSFAMQMILVLITGHMLATTALMKRLLKELTSKVSSPTQGLLVLSVFSLISCWINWGFGLIVSGLLAVELARKLKRINFGLYVATAYSGFIVWHGGLSGSIPLKMAGKDEVLSKVYPELSIPLSQTIFSPWNLGLVLSLLILMPLLSLLMNSQASAVEVRAEEEDEAQVALPGHSLSEKLEAASWLNVLFGALFLVALGHALLGGAAFDINRLNMLFISLALLLHRTPRQFLFALTRSFSSASGIAIQFPLYAGVMGLIQYSGLGDLISQGFVSIASAQTLPPWAFLSGGVVNTFVPSGGGQWAVQGPIMLKAAKDLGADPAKVAMGIAWGDGWTNLIQPFWTLPLLALAKIQLKEIMGYCLIYVVASGVLLSGVFLLMSYW